MGTIVSSTTIALGRILLLGKSLSADGCEGRFFLCCSFVFFFKWICWTFYVELIDIRL